MARKVNPDDARQLMIDAGLIPLVPFVNTSAKWNCRCTTCNREVFPTYSKVKSGYRGCLYCAGKKVDLQELEHILK